MKKPSTLTIVLLAASLQGCMLVPGQHMTRSSVVAPGTAQAGQVELVPITSQLVATMSQAAPTVDVPPALLDYRPGPYHIGSGDQIFITVWGHPELTTPGGGQSFSINSRQVRTDGTLFYPFVGNLKVTGMTVEQLRETISRRLAKFIEEPQVDLNVVTYASQRVSFQGAFAKTEPQPITAVPLTLDQALGVAGINAAQADLSGLVLTRDGHEYRLDLGALNQRSQLAKSIYLKGGDRLYLPYSDSNEIYVLGEVLRPQAVNFKISDPSLTQALGRAGGLDQITAKGKAVYVIRGSKQLQRVPARVYQLDARSPAAFALADEFKVKPGDVVFVGASGVTRWSRLVNQLLPFSSIVGSTTQTQHTWRAEP